MLLLGETVAGCVAFAGVVMVTEELLVVWFSVAFGEAVVMVTVVTLAVLLCADAVVMLLVLLGLDWVVVLGALLVEVLV